MQIFAHCHLLNSPSPRVYYSIQVTTHAQKDVPSTNTYNIDSYPISSLGWIFTSVLSPDFSRVSRGYERIEEACSMIKSLRKVYFLHPTCHYLWSFLLGTITVRCEFTLSAAENYSQLQVDTYRSDPDDRMKGVLHGTVAHSWNGSM